MHARLHGKISVSSVRRLQSARALPFVKVGGSVRFTKGDIASYLARNRGPYIGRLLAEEIGGKIETAFLFLRFDAPSIRQIHCGMAARSARARAVNAPRPPRGAPMARGVTARGAIRAIVVHRPQGRVSWIEDVCRSRGGGTYAVRSPRVV